MKRIFLFSISAVLILFAENLHAQNLLNGPESVAFDTPNNRILVSNVYGGAIIAIDEYGIHDYFMTGLGSCLGNTITGNAIYVSVPDGVMGFDLDTRDTVLDLTIPTWGHTDGLAADTSGYLYVVDTGRRIYKIDLTDGTYWQYASAGLPGILQDIAFDEVNNRLLAVGFASLSTIVAVNLGDSTTEMLVQTPFGQCDGVAIDQFGNTYVTSYSTNGQIYRYGPEYENPAELISTGHNGPAGIDYHRGDNIVGVPNFYSNRVDLIEIVPLSAGDNMSPLEFVMSQSTPNPFNNSVNIEYLLRAGSPVTVAIYDMLGRKIETIFNGFQSAGEHTQHWNAADRSTGVYFYRIEAGDLIETRKMLLLK